MPFYAYLKGDWLSALESSMVDARAAPIATDFCVAEEFRDGPIGDTSLWTVFSSCD
jgi:hypothetical protein